MGVVETSGFKAWWPLKEFQGRTADGKNVVTPGFRNMVTGEFHAPEKGFDGEPPRPSGDLSNVRHVSDAYRENFDLIDWEHPIFVTFDELDRLIQEGENPVKSTRERFRENFDRIKWNLQGEAN